jgi:hypothetical protein
MREIALGWLAFLLSTVFLFATVRRDYHGRAVRGPFILQAIPSDGVNRDNTYVNEALDDAPRSPVNRATTATGVP